MYVSHVYIIFASLLKIFSRFWLLKGKIKQKDLKRICSWSVFRGKCVGGRKRSLLKICLKTFQFSFNSISNDFSSQLVAIIKFMMNLNWKIFLGKWQKSSILEILSNCRSQLEWIYALTLYHL